MSALWHVFLQQQLEIREGKDKVLATWIRGVIIWAVGPRSLMLLRPVVLVS